MVEHGLVYALIHFYYSLHWTCPLHFPPTAYKPLANYSGSWYELYSFPHNKHLTEPSCLCPISHNSVEDEGTNSGAILEERYCLAGERWIKDAEWRLIQQTNERGGARGNLFTAERVTRIHRRRKSYTNFIFNRADDPSVALEFSCHRNFFFATWSYRLISRSKQISQESKRWTLSILDQMNSDKRHVASYFDFNSHDECP